MKVVLDENFWDEKRHFHPNLDESVPNWFLHHVCWFHEDFQKRIRSATVGAHRTGLIQ